MSPMNVTAGRSLQRSRPRLWRMSLHIRDGAAFIVDEAVTITEDESGARTLGDLIRRGRHWGLEVHVLTQRVTDWFDTRIGRTIQSVAASKWFGQLEARELFEIAPSLGLSPDERDRIEKAGTGRGIIGDERPASVGKLYGHTSPGVFDGQYRSHR